MRIIPLVILLALAAPALADEPRAIDFTVVLTDADGAPVVECADPDEKECKTKRPVTLGMCAMRALSAPEPGLAQDEALKRGQLALSVYKAPAAKLTAEEISMIKKTIAKVYGPLMVARSFAILDPATAK